MKVFLILTVEYGFEGYEKTKAFYKRIILLFNQKGIFEIIIILLYN